MKKIADWFLIGCFALFLAAVAGWTLTHTSETVSYYENRTLAAQPEATAEALLSGSYFESWERFFTDHAAGRDTMLRLNTALELSVLRLPSVSRQVPQGELLLPLIESDRPYEKKIVGAANAMAESLAGLNARIGSYGGRFYYVGVPEQYSYYKDRYPDYLKNGQNTLSTVHAAFSGALAEAGVPFLDMAERYDALGRPQELYFATDHHYSVYGALAVYDALMERLEADGVPVSPLSREDWRFTTLPNPVLGSRNRKLYGMFPNTDALTLAEPASAIPFTRVDNGWKESETLFKLPGSETVQVSYGVFMGDDWAETVVKTGRPELPNVLIYGDSFTNALETLLYTSFNEMRSLDLRHYTEMTLTEYIDAYRPDVVICVRDDSNYLMATGNGDVK